MIRYNITIAMENGEFVAYFKNRNNTNYVVARKVMEDTTFTGCFEDGQTEYYAEHDDYGIFIYTKDYNLIKEDTWIQDFKVSPTRNIYPKKSVWYI